MIFATRREAALYTLGILCDNWNAECAEWRAAYHCAVRVMRVAMVRERSAKSV